MKYLIITFLSFSYLTTAQTYKIKDHKVSFKVPYTFGDHEGVAEKINGSFDVKKGGKISLNVTSLKTEKETMTCHLYESLGIDYSKSDFPDEHVCKDDKLPEGVMAYPEIVYSINSVKKLNETDDAIEFQLEGSLSIHGKSRKKTIQTILKKNENSFNSNNEVKISLKDFGVVVKNFLFISVEDEVTVNLDLEWEKL